VDATRSSFLRHAELVVDGVRASAERARVALQARRAERDVLATRVGALLAEAAKGAGSGTNGTAARGI
jgi:hypothetical protein